MTPAEELRAARATSRPLCPTCRRRPMHVGAGSWQGRCASCLGLNNATALESSATQPLPPDEVLTGEVTSPYGPCSGLAADKRDNTCTNFAAEYVEHECTVAGLTVGDVFTPATRLSRLCTPCADVAPGRISRRPLTTTPGGYPVERA